MMLMATFKERRNKKEGSCDVKEMANAVAEELAVEHYSFYGDKTSKAVKGSFLNQLYRSWGLATHRGWARFLLDRRSSCWFLMPHTAGYAQTIAIMKKHLWIAISNTRSTISSA